MVFDATKIVDFPAIMLYTDKTVANCANTTVTSSISLTLTGARSWSVTKTNGVLTTSGGSISGQAQMQNVGGITLTHNWSGQVSSSTATQESNSTTVTRTISDSVSIPPHTAVQIAARAIQQTIEIPFHATVVVDGDLPSAPRDQAMDFRTAGQLINETERTLQINGTLSSTDVTEASLRVEPIQGGVGCNQDAAEGLTDLEENVTYAVPLNGASKWLTEGFIDESEILKMKLEDQSREATRIFEIPKTMRPFGALDGGTIEAPDGTYYEVLYTTEVVRPFVGCGFNDLMQPNPAAFSVEARQYRQYVQGKLVSQWQDTVESFKECRPI
ncbi:MAG TPA: hypothetical protein PKA13_08370 [Geminicoccaceae bacterium]|nr:hypothetical protein [Geminicoccus sp.]HMU49777.1 hypothetical protein [Geminicoccaceae bacterium]